MGGAVKYATDGHKRYMRGLEAADSKGFAAGQDESFSEKDCPYKNYEHKRCWTDGFRRARANATQP